MYLKYFLFFLSCILPCALSCGGQESANPYYDRMRKLSDDFRVNPDDKATLKELEHYTTDTNFWNKSYAYSFLRTLAVDNTGGCQKELIPVFKRGLEDSNRSIKNDACEAIVDIGPVAADSAEKELMQIVKNGAENDLSWNAIKAMGKMRESKNISDVLPVLFKLAGTPPPVGTPDEAPQRRYEALRSIVELSATGNATIVPKLVELLKLSVAPYKQRVAKAILEIAPGNQDAQQALQPHQ